MNDNRVLQFLKELEPDFTINSLEEKTKLHHQNFYYCIRQNKISLRMRNTIVMNYDLTDEQKERLDVLMFSNKDDSKFIYVFFKSLEDDLTIKEICDKLNITNDQYKTAIRRGFITIPVAKKIIDKYKLKTEQLKELARLIEHK